MVNPNFGAEVPGVDPLGPPGSKPIETSHASLSSPDAARLQG